MAALEEVIREIEVTPQHIPIPGPVEMPTIAPVEAPPEQPLVPAGGVS